MPNKTNDNNNKFISDQTKESSETVIGYGVCCNTPNNRTISSAVDCLCAWRIHCTLYSVRQQQNWLESLNDHVGSIKSLSICKITKKVVAVTAVERKFTVCLWKTCVRSRTNSHASSFHPTAEKKRRRVVFIEFWFLFLFSLWIFQIKEMKFTDQSCCSRVFFFNCFTSKLTSYFQLRKKKL